MGPLPKQICRGEERGLEVMVQEMQALEEWKAAKGQAPLEELVQPTTPSGGAHLEGV